MMTHGTPAACTRRHPPPVPRPDMPRRLFIELYCTAARGGTPQRPPPYSGTLPVNMYTLVQRRQALAPRGCMLIQLPGG